MLGTVSRAKDARIGSLTLCHLGELSSLPSCCMPSRAEPSGRRRLLGSLPSLLRAAASGISAWQACVFLSLSTGRGHKAPCLHQVLAPFVGRHPGSVLRITSELLFGIEEMCRQAGCLVLGGGGRFLLGSLDHNEGMVDQEENRRGWIPGSLQKPSSSCSKEPG